MEETNILSRHKTISKNNGSFSRISVANHEAANTAYPNTDPQLIFTLELLSFTLPSRRLSEYNMSNSGKTKKRIRKAAGAVVAEQGAGKLTIEAVASEAGISKGGLLYHYGTKKELLEGMLDDLLLERGALFQTDKDHSSRKKLRSLIETEFALSSEERATAQSILAAGAEDPALLEPARDYFQTLFKHIRHEKDDPTLTITVALALQGMQLLETIGLYQFDKNQKSQLKKRLLELVS